MWAPPQIIASLLTRWGWNPTVIRAGSRLHKALLRRFGGASLVGKDTLVLTTRGWKTGRETSTPLFYAEDDDHHLLVAASFAGSGNMPVWYRNLVAHPDVEVTIGGHSARYRARTLSSEEAELAWPQLIAVYPTFMRYRRRTLRTIPLVELSSMHASQVDSPAACQP